MPLTLHGPLATTLAERLRHARAELATRWLDRIVARVDIEPTLFLRTRTTAVRDLAS